jgi:hypothetical protein
MAGRWVVTRSENFISYYRQVGVPHLLVVVRRADRRYDPDVGYWHKLSTSEFDITVYSYGEPIGIHTYHPRTRMWSMTPSQVGQHARRIINAYRKEHQ